MITWSIDPDLALDQVKDNDVREAIIAAVCQWQALLAAPLVRKWTVCGAKIRFRSARLVGALELADSDCYPLHDSRFRVIRFNQRAVWTKRLLLCVAGHELGHALGLEHGPSGSLMAGEIDELVTAPQPADRWALWAMYPTLAAAWH